MRRVRLCRIAQGAALALLIGISVVWASPAGAQTITPIPGSTQGGALQPGFDLGRFGYDISEFFVDGTADSYHSVGSLTNTSEWTVAPDGAPQPFTTRIQVLTPADPDTFNGTVYVEWLNVSAQRDVAPAWGVGRVEIKRQGAIYVGVSAQFAGVSQLKSSFPDRYGPLVHPGDSYSYDIFTQVGQTLRDHADAVFGIEFEPQRFIAMGHSQSGSRLVTYVNGFGDDGTFDGYLPSGTGANPSAPLRQEPLERIDTPNPTLITEFDKPVLREQSETESRVARQDDSANFRWWEVAGTSHNDSYGFAGDYGDSPEGAQRAFDFMMNPFSGPIAEFGHCQYGINSGPGAWVDHAAIRHMNAWVKDGIPPPAAPRLVTVDGTPTGALVLDEHGNATGGIRSPHLDVPIATLTGTGNAPATPGVNFCRLFGTTIPFSADKLAALYPTHGAFVSKWNQAVDAGVAAGFMTPEDGEFVKVSAARSDIGKT